MLQEGEFGVVCKVGVGCLFYHFCESYVMEVRKYNHIHFQKLKL